MNEDKMHAELKRLRDLADGVAIYGAPDQKQRAKQLRSVADNIEAALSVSEGAAPVAKQPWPNHNWCVNCTPENCQGCGTEPVERRTPQPAVNGAGLPDVKALFKEALSWGLVYGTAMAPGQWEELSDKQASLFAQRFAPTAPPTGATEPMARLERRAFEGVQTYALHPARRPDGSLVWEDLPPGGYDLYIRPAETFQARVQPWMMECFGEMIAGDKEERNHRFLEEALELVQACGCSENEANQLVSYVYGRPVGEPSQEVGGVMVTLAALCLAQGLDMHEAADTELARVWTKVEAIRAKQASKPKYSPLPESPKGT